MGQHDLTKRAHGRSAELSTGSSGGNMGVDLELLVEILAELKKLNERETSLKLRPIFKPRPEPKPEPEIQKPSFWDRLFRRPLKEQ